MIKTVVYEGKKYKRVIPKGDKDDGMCPRCAFHMHPLSYCFNLVSDQYMQESACKTFVFQQVFGPLNKETHVL